MAVLQNAFVGACGMGLKLVPRDPKARQEYNKKLRADYEDALYEARKFFYEQKLFIPQTVADKAKETLDQVIMEKNLYDFLAIDTDSEIKAQYSTDLAKLSDNFG